jgi:CRISPR-associated protein Cas2
MFVIISYDVGEKRVGKVHKTLKRYLQWTQNSVFEGEITEGKLKECLGELMPRINVKEDSLYVYKVSNPRNIKKVIYGIEKDFEEMFL